MHERGYEVILIGRKLQSSKEMESRLYKTKRLRLFFEKGALFYAFFNLRLFFVLLFRRVDILVSNDLDTLLPNYLVSKLRSKKLVYDSHEYFTEVPELIERPKVQKVWLRIERFIFPKLTNIITVNNSISNKYHERYNKQLVVVRNVSPLWIEENCLSKEDLGIPTGKQICIMQGAGLNKDRGVEEAIRAFEFIDNAVLLIVGHGDVIPEMKILVKQLSLTDKVLFFGKRPYKELMHFTAHANLGFSFDQPSNENYLFSLPNKIFDYLHAETPILCSNLVEVAGIVNKYNIGQIVTDFSSEALAKQISTILTDSILLKTWKENCQKAKQIECWENEVQKLVQIYPEVNE